MMKTTTSDPHPDQLTGWQRGPRPRRGVTSGRRYEGARIGEDAGPR
jgi:hypothetical protein